MGALMYAVFDSLESFNAWHNDIKEKLNFPIYGTNQATGQTDYNNPTTEFTEPLTNSKDQRVIANVVDEIDGLEIIDEKLDEWSDWFPKAIWEIKESE
jgi:hypothetical protein